MEKGAVGSMAPSENAGGQSVFSSSILKGIYTPAGIAYIFKFGLTWSPFTYSMTLDVYHIDSVNTCYD